MAQQKIVYLVMSGECDEYREEAILSTPELADALVAEIPANQYPRVVPMPVLDYVPAKVTVWEYRLRHTQETGWVVGGVVDNEVWDFQAPGTVVGVRTHSYTERGWNSPRSVTVQAVHLAHRDQEVARQEAEDVLASLQAGARPPAGLSDDSPE